MSAKENTKAFNDLRGSFDGLEVDEQARFLVEAAMSLVANGAKEASNVVSKVVEDLVDNIKCDDDDSEAEEAAEEEKPKAAPKAKPKAKRRPAQKKPPAKDA